MADKLPVKAIFDSQGDTEALGEFETGDTTPILHGGTGADNAADALTNLGACSQVDFLQSVVGILQHTYDTTIHYTIDDTTIVTNKPWSSFKIDAELANKADVGHNHNTLYFTQQEIIWRDALQSAWAWTCRTSASDTEHGYLDTKIRAGTGATLTELTTSNTPATGNIFEITTDVWNGGVNFTIQTFYTDATKSNKTLSVPTMMYTWSGATVTNDGWIQIGNTSDADSGHIIPIQATIIMSTCHCEDDGGTAKDIKLYINGTDSGVVASSSGNGEGGTTTGLNINVAAGDKIRLRGASTGGTINDTIVTLYVKWRA